MPDPRSLEEQTKTVLLDAIRTQTAAAAKDLPRPGAAALRDLAEAYAVITTEPLPLLPEPVPTIEDDDR